MEIEDQYDLNQSNDKKIDILNCVEKEFFHNEISFQSYIIDSDYIGWKYIFPSNDQKVIVIESYLNPNTSIEIEYVLIDSPAIHIRTWEDFDDSPLAYAFFYRILTFDHNVNNFDILKC